MRLFVDTSALAKRYIAEAGSEWVRSWCREESGNTIGISFLTTVEMFSLLARRVSENNVDQTMANAIEKMFISHIRTQYTVVSYDDTILAEARRLIKAYRLRTLDALQLAAALAFAALGGEQIVFICADARLLDAAAAEGLPIDSPGNHLNPMD